MRDCNRKAAGQPARLCYLGNLLIENRNNLVVDTETTRATGWAERAAAEAMIEHTAPKGRGTLGADKAHDAAAMDVGDVLLERAPADVAKASSEWNTPGQRPRLRRWLQPRSSVRGRVRPVATARACWPRPVRFGDRIGGQP